MRAALDAISSDGSGVLLYMNQEGRGIGLANKMRAYALQNQGFDTVEANHRLGFEDDERNFKLGAEILRLMGFESVRLMTNNPAKVASMEAVGITVSERVALKVGSNPLNEMYLETKSKKKWPYFMNPKFHDLVVTHWGARFMGCNLAVAVGRSGISKKNWRRRWNYASW